jgi:hypothetical protein
MRSVTSAVAALAVCVFVAPVAQGLGVHQDFNGYTVPGSSSAWYYMINNSPATGVFVGDADAGAGVDPAAYFYLNHNNFVVGAGANPTAAGNKVYFETYSTLNAGVAANLFSSAIAVVSQDAGAPASTVSAIEYYLYVDTVGNDNLADSYYTSTLSLAGSPGTLQTYPTRSLTDNTATWNQYNWSVVLGDWVPAGTVTSISSASRMRRSLSVCSLTCCPSHPSGATT